MKKNIVFVLLLPLTLWVAVAHTDPSAADTGGQPVNITADSSQQVMPLQGQDVVISGHYNKIQLTGTMGKVTITGSYNDIDIDTVSTISITGHYNFVTWRSGATTTTDPTVSDKGSYNNAGKR